jgi:hypothetical protein
MMVPPAPKGRHLQITVGTAAGGDRYGLKIREELTIKTAGCQSHIHMVGAWDSDICLVLGQLKTDEKSNLLWIFRSNPVSNF